MNLPDLYIEREASDPEIVQAVAEVIGIRSDDVVLYGTYAELLANHSAPVQVERLCVCGAFPIRIGVHPSAGFLATTVDAVALLIQLCAALATRGVIADESSDNPYAFTLLTPGGAPRSVTVDPEHIEHGEIVLSSAVAATHD